MGFFTGLKSAQTFDSGTPFKREGMYILKVTKALAKETLAKGPAFIVEFQVLETTTADTDPVGSTRSWFQKLVNKGVGFGAVKEFMYAVEGLDKQRDAAKITKFDEKIEELMDAVTEKNAIAGELVRLETSQITTKEGKPFTRHSWSHVSDEEKSALLG